MPELFSRCLDILIVNMGLYQIKKNLNQIEVCCMEVGLDMNTKSSLSSIFMTGYVANFCSITVKTGAILRQLDRFKQHLIYDILCKIMFPYHVLQKGLCYK